MRHAAFLIARLRALNTRKSWPIAITQIIVALELLHIARLCSSNSRTESLPIAKLIVTLDCLHIVCLRASRVLSCNDILPITQLTVAHELLYCTP